MRILALAFSLCLMIGCSNVIRSGLLNSNSIFLPPSSDRTVYVELHNISENQQVTLSGVATRLAAKGYQVVKNPEQARYWLQASIVYCHKAGMGVTAEQVVQSGFGSGVGRGGTALAGMNPFMGGGETVPDMTAMMAQMRSAMAGMGAPMGPPPEEGVLYLCAADVQVTERMKAGTAPQQTGQMPSGAGVSNVHRVRMVASVRQKQLRIEEATPIIQEKLSTGLAGLF